MSLMNANVSKAKVGEQFGLGRGSVFFYFKVIEAGTIEISEWFGYDIRRTTKVPVPAARARWAQLTKEGFETANPEAVPT